MFAENVLILLSKGTRYAKSAAQSNKGDIRKLSCVCASMRVGMRGDGVGYVVGLVMAVAAWRGDRLFYHVLGAVACDGTE